MPDFLPDIEGDDGTIREAIPVLPVSADGRTGVVTLVSELDAAVAEGRAYSASTSVQAIATGERLKARLSNPSGSGKRLKVTQRFFSNDRQGDDAMLRRGLIVQPSAIAGATEVSANNLLPGAATSEARFAFATDAATLGASVVENLMPLNGGTERVDVPRYVLPGDSFAYEIEGAGDGTVQSPAAAAIAFVWIEEDL